MADDFRTIITIAGQNAFADAIANGTPVVIAEVAIGDSDGVGYNPDENQAALVNEVYRAAHDGVEVLTGGVIVVTLNVPATQGGWHIREAGVLDDAGTLLAVVRIADRYKPLPSSGQADDLTIKLKLDVGNVGAVTWTLDPSRRDTIAAQLAPDYRSVLGFGDDPPATPVAGDTWIVGTAPTGAWAGQENQLVEWTGVGWDFVAPTPWYHVGLPDRTDWRWDATLATPAWVLWQATETVRGPVELATVAETRDGTDATRAVTPAGLLGALRAGAGFPDTFASDINVMVYSGNNYDVATAVLCATREFVSKYPGQRTLIYAECPTNLSVSKYGTFTGYGRLAPRATGVESYMSGQNPVDVTVPGDAGLLRRVWSDSVPTLLATKAAGVANFSVDLLAYWSQQYGEGTPYETELYIDTVTIAVFERPIPPEFDLATAVSDGSIVPTVL